MRTRADTASFITRGEPLEREKDLQILYRLVWFGTPSDVTTEANDGRGPVDFKVSRGAADKTLVEMKLAKNTKLERNLERQVPICQAASDAKRAIKAIIFFSKTEEERAEGILDRLGILGHRDIVLIDARSDNKPSGSHAGFPDFRSKLTHSRQRAPAHVASRMTVKCHAAINALAAPATPLHSSHRRPGRS